MTFTPATSKLEALLRISAGTGKSFRPLGPGSKEKKSALEDVAIALGLPVDLSQPKPELASSIAQALGEPWDDHCWSVGQTITLVGLNRVLRGAEHHSLWQQAPIAPIGSREEAEAIVSTLTPAISQRWDGRACVMEMLEAGSTQWAQMEWAGWYFEFVGITRCIEKLGGGPMTFPPTRFDYARKFVWDFKTHANENSLILNDLAAINQASENRGVGFVVLSVVATIDEDGSFEEWHDNLKHAYGKGFRKPKIEHSHHRKRKAAVQPACLDIVFFPERSAIEGALDMGVLSIYAQGRQPSGEPRLPKYLLSLRAARESQYHVIHQDL